MCCWADHEFKLGDTALLLTTAARRIHGRLFAKDNHYTCSLHLREAILQSLMIKVVFMQRISAAWAVITVSAASSFLFQASLSSRESASNTELERAINSADVVKAASPVDAFDDDPSLLGTAPAFKRFPTCQWLDDLFHHRRTNWMAESEAEHGLWPHARREKELYNASSSHHVFCVQTMMVVTIVPIQHNCLYHCQGFTGTVDLL